jgi:zona occludens toxin
VAINLMTGLPGACKTLYSLAFVREWAERDNRPVFYSGVKGLTIENWTEIDAEKWYECPPNSIVIIDECQRVFRPRTTGKEPPKYVSELETHRHQGIDLWLITQHPNLCDIAVRRLTQRHLHAHRIFGMQWATIHEWQGAQVDCEKESAKKKSISIKWKFDKKAFDYYKSAEVHTVKRSIPMKVYFLFLLPVIFLGLVYMAYQKLKAKPIEMAPAVTAGSLTDAARAASNPSKPVFDARADAKNYVDMHTPRYVGLQHTAPIYDEIRKPTEAPLPAACIESNSKGCVCYSQQGTVLQVAKQMCSEIVARGYFDDAPKKIDLKSVNYSAGSSPVPAAFNAAAVPVSQIASVAPAGNNQDGYGVLGKRGKGVSQPKYD